MACWITKAKDIHSEYVFYYWLHLHGNSCYANVHQYYIYTYIARLVPYALVFMLDIPILDTQFSTSVPLHDYTLQVCLLFRPFHCIVWGAKHDIPDCKILHFKGTKIHVRQTVFWVLMLCNLVDGACGHGTYCIYLKPHYHPSHLAYTAWSFTHHTYFYLCDKPEDRSLDKVRPPLPQWNKIYLMSLVLRKSGRKICPCNRTICS